MGSIKSILQASKSHTGEVYFSDENSHQIVTNNEKLKCQDYVNLEGMAPENLKNV